MFLCGRSKLCGGDLDYEALVAFGQGELASEAAVVRSRGSDVVEDVVFDFIDRGKGRSGAFLDVDMARAALSGTSALPNDSVDVVVDRESHH